MVAQTFVLLNMLAATSTVLASSSTFLRSNIAPTVATSSYDPGCFDDDNAKFGPYCASEGDCGDCINLRDRIAGGEDVSANCAAAAGEFCKKSCNKCPTTTTVASTDTDETSTDTD